MRKFLFILLCVLGLSGSACCAALIDDLTDGQHVLLIRHADAPGFGDPPGYRLDDCATQRNLGEVGRTQSVLMGKWLAQQGVVRARMMSSAWCRCLDTAKLMDKGPVLIDPSLGSFFDDARLNQTQTVALQKMIATKLLENKSIPLILVTHHVNIQAFTGEVVSVGDMVLVHVTPDGAYLSHQVLAVPPVSK